MPSGMVSVIGLTDSTRAEKLIRKAIDTSALTKVFDHSNKEAPKPSGYSGQNEVGGWLTAVTMDDGGSFSTKITTAFGTNVKLKVTDSKTGREVLEPVVDGIALFHELAHATGAKGNEAIPIENEIRAELGLNLRTGSDH